MGQFERGTGSASPKREKGRRSDAGEEKDVVATQPPLKEGVDILGTGAGRGGTEKMDKGYCGVSRVALGREHCRYAEVQGQMNRRNNRGSHTQRPQTRG